MSVWHLSADPHCDENHASTTKPFRSYNGHLHTHDDRICTLKMIAPSSKAGCQWICQPHPDPSRSHPLSCPRPFCPTLLQTRTCVPYLGI